MSKFQLVKKALKSEKVRNLLFSQTNGIRKVNSKEEDEGGIISDIYRGVSKVFGGTIKYVVSLVGNFISNISFSWLAGLFVGGATRIMNFNWNVTDAQLDAIIPQLQRRIAGQLGETMGNQLGYLLCGIAPGVALVQFNQALGYHVLKEVGEEMLEELYSDLKVLANQTFNLYFTNLGIQAFKNTRKWIKEAAKDKNSITSRIGRSVFGANFDTAVEAWGEESTEPWTFRKYIDDKIESIEDPLKQEYWEELVDAFFDACGESFFVLGNAADEWMMQQRLEKEGLLGKEETVEIVLNRDMENEPYRESVILHGPANLLKGQMTTVMAVNQLLEYRSPGPTIEGENPVSYARKMQSQYEIKIFWSSSRDGINRDGETWTRCTISNISRAKISNWELIKQMAGGRNGRMYGNLQLTAEMSDGSKITVNTSSESDGKKLIKDLATLTDNDILTIKQFGYLRKEGELAIHYDDHYYRQPERVYPAKLTIINKYRVLNLTSETLSGGRHKRSGQYLKKEFDIPLWTDSEPSNFKALVTEAMKIPGTNP